MLTITEEQWLLYSKKYTRLMWTIAHRISGDSMLASVDDNYSDLCIAALESISGFHKKTGSTFDEMMTLKFFDQYTKTCLWTAKARKGIKLTERMPFRRRHVSINSLIDNASIEFDVPDTSLNARHANVDVIDAYENYDSKIKKLIDILSMYPETMTEGGNIKIDPIAKLMKMPKAKVKTLLRIMERTNQ